MTTAAATLHFTELLLALIKGNTGLIDSLRVLAAEDIEKPVKDSALLLLALMKKGRGFSESLRLVQNKNLSFSPLYITLIAAAELTGNIAGVLDRIAADLRARQGAKENALNILIYPAAIILVALAGTILLIARGMPRFIADGFLSGQTRETALAGIFAAGMVLLLGGSAVFFLYFRLFYFDSPEFSVFYLLDFLLKNEVPLMEALGHCAASVSGARAGNALVVIKKDIAAGVSFSRAFGALPRLSPYVRGWLAAADSHGNIAEMCGNIRDYYARKDARARAAASKLIEPLIILLTGVYLLIIIVTVILPMLTYAGGLI
jgi:general secretion pathway protein F